MKNRAEKNTGQAGTPDFTGFVRLVPIILYGHTFATLALQNGVDIKTVSWMLGHHDAGFTLRTYTHATVAMQEQTAATMGSIMAQSM